MAKRAQGVGSRGTKATKKVTRAKRPHGSGSPREVRTGVWQLRWQEAGRSRSKTIHGTKTKADAALRDLTRESARVRRGSLLSENPTMTVREWLDHWLSVRTPELAATTAVKYRRIVERDLVPVIGNIPIRNLAVPDVEVLLARYAGRPWRREVHIVLRSALSAAERADVVSRNVARRVQAKVQQRPERKVLSLDEVTTFLEVLRGDGLEAYFLTALSTGARSGELRALRWSDIDFDTGDLLIERGITRTPQTGWVIGPTKTAHSRRTVWLPEEVRKALKQHRWEQASTRRKARQESSEKRQDWDDAEAEYGALVFRTRNGNPLSLQAVGRKLRRLLEEAGLPQVRGHDLRHGFASYMLSQGEPMPNVSRMLGHANIAVTVDTYGHLLQDAQREAGQRLAEVMFR